MHLFDKPKERNLRYAAICYLLIPISFGVFGLLLFGPTPSGAQPVGESVAFTATLIVALLTIKLFEQAEQWRNPKPAKRYH